MKYKLVLLHFCIKLIVCKALFDSYYFNDLRQILVSKSKPKRIEILTFETDMPSFV